MIKISNRLKAFLLVFAVIFFNFWLVAQPIGAQTIRDRLTPFSTVYGYQEGSTPTISTIVAQIIQYLLSFLGILFIVLIIYGGFIYMMAKGDDAEVTKAKDILQRAIIGLVIILSSYTITYFIIKNLTKTTGSYY